MAHFAELDDDDIVIRVLVVDNDRCLDDSGAESESIGAGFLASVCGGRWVQTSYNARIRKNYAGPGFAYDPVLDAFIPPQPFPSWTLDADTCQWLPPVPRPDDGTWVEWHEDTMSWVPIA